jgi:uncharacterized repeat protein (TIGR01451 family)
VASAGLLAVWLVSATSHPAPAQTIEVPLAEPAWLGPEATEPVEPDDPPVPVVALRVRVPATVALGQEIEYHLCVENCSEAPAHHVIVRNPLPANARFVRAQPEPAVMEPELRWHLGTLEPFARRDILLVLAPTGTGDVRNCARVQFEHGQCVTTHVARPGLRLRKEGPTQAVLYDALTFRLEVSNTGTAPATNVVLTDSLPEGLEPSSGRNPLTWDLGTLEPGRTRTVEYQAVAKTTGRLCNRAVVTAAGGLREQAESCVSVGEAKLALTKTGPAQYYLNRATTYQLTVSNPGTAPATNVVLSDPLPEQMQFIRAGDNGQLVGTEVRWTIGTLEPGATRTVDVVLRATAAGRICNRATATADRGLSAQAEACTEFAGVSGLLFEVVDTDDPVEVGGETAYIITVRNQGTAQMTNLRIVATVPDQLAVTRATGPSDHRKEGQKVVFDPLTLAAGAEVRYQIYVKALQPGDVRFKVDLSADQLPSGPLHEEESTTLYRDVPAPR